MAGDHDGQLARPHRGRLCLRGIIPPKVPGRTARSRRQSRPGPHPAPTTGVGVWTRSPTRAPPERLPRGPAPGAPGAPARARKPPGPVAAIHRSPVPRLGRPHEVTLGGGAGSSPNCLLDVAWGLPVKQPGAGCWPAHEPPLPTTTVRGLSTGRRWRRHALQASPGSGRDAAGSSRLMVKRGCPAARHHGADVVRGSPWHSWVSSCSGRGRRTWCGIGRRVRLPLAPMEPR